MRRQLFSLVLLPLICVSTFAAEVNVPAEFNHRFIRELLVSQIYTGNNETAPVFTDRMQCNYLTLSNPQVTSRGDQLQITSAGKARIGAAVGKRCLKILNWQGFIEVYQKPYIENEASSVKFQVVGSNIYDQDGQKQAATGKLWDWVKGYVHPRLDDLEIDLKSVLHELGVLFSATLARSDQKITPRLVDSVSLAGVETMPSGVRVKLQIDLPGPPPRTVVIPEPVLSTEELKQWEDTWQQWDAFITYVIKSSANDTEEQALRLALLEVLIAARYDLIDALAVARPGEPDTVRQLFLKSWVRLAPLLRNLSSDLSGTSALGYLSFIAAADALQAADQLGEGLGLEISADGLRRLARMIVPQPQQDPLKYSKEVDPELRKIFGFGPPLPLSDERSSRDILDWILSSADAAEGPDRALVRRLNGWVPTRDKLNTYLPLVRDLLSQTTRGLLQQEIP